MSITFYVEDWHKQPSSQIKVYMDEEYGLEESYFEDDPCIQKDSDGRYFEMRTVYENPFPELNLGNLNAKLLLNALGYQFYYHASFPVEQLSEVINNCMKLINNENKMVANERPSFQEGNIISMGVTSPYIFEKTQILMDLLVFAKINNKSVYWA